MVQDHSIYKIQLAFGYVEKFFERLGSKIKSKQHVTMKFVTYRKDPDANQDTTAKTIR